MRLRITKTVKIIPTAPFYFDATVFKPAHFPTRDTKWVPGKRWQTMYWKRKKLGLILENAGTTSKPQVNLQIFSDRKLAKDYLKSVKKEVVYRFNLDLDLEEFIEKFRNHPVLSSSIKRLKGMRPMTHGSLYDYLIIAIMLQNAPVRRSTNMMQALFEKYGTLLEYGGEELYCMWKPESLAQVSEEELRKLKLGYRAKYLKKISQQFATGKIDELELREKSLEDQRKTLMALYGIGPQSVAYIMKDIFHRWDFMEHIPPWERKILSKIIFNTEPEKPVEEKELLQFFEELGQYKGLAAHYIWEDLWWQHHQKPIPWLEKLVRL